MANITHRFLDADQELLNKAIPLINCTAEPLVSLKEAFAKLPEFMIGVDSCIKMVMERCRNPTECLSQDESAAIALYRIEQYSGFPNLCSKLNDALRGGDQQELGPWLSYLKILVTALSKLPSNRCTLWRGAFGDLSQKYREGDKITWCGFSSCITSLKVLESDQYSRKYEVRTLFLIECSNGKCITDYSYHEDKEEVLLLPCTCFKVISNFSKENLCIIQLREDPSNIPPESSFRTLSGKKGIRLF